MPTNQQTSFMSDLDVQLPSAFGMLQFIYATSWMNQTLYNLITSSWMKQTLYSLITSCFVVIQTNGLLTCQRWINESWINLPKCAHGIEVHVYCKMINSVHSICDELYWNSYLFSGDILSVFWWCCIVLIDPFAEANAEDSGAGPGAKDYVHVRIQQRNGRKSLTTVQGLKKEYSYNKILKDLKKEFCCNGTVVQDPELGQVCT